MCVTLVRATSSTASALMSKDMAAVSRQQAGQWKCESVDFRHQSGRHQNKQIETNRNSVQCFAVAPNQKQRPSHEEA